MKNFNSIALVFYFLALVSSSIIFYFLFYPSVIDPSNPGQRLVSSSSAQTIFFSSDNNLYQLYADNSIDRLGAPAMKSVVANVSINSLAVGQSSDIYFDNQSTSSAIDSLKLPAGTPSILFSSDSPGLNQFSSFSGPKISNDKKSLVFKTSDPKNDYLILFNFQTKKITNLSRYIGLDHINDYAWDSTGQNLIIDGSNNSHYSLVKYSAFTQKAETVKQTETKVAQLKWENHVIYFLQSTQINGAEAINLFGLNMTNKQQTMISAVGNQNNVAGFDISTNGDSIIIEESSPVDGKSDLFICQSDGSNLLQITKDGKSALPVFLQNSEEIVFWKKGSGLYKTSVGQNQPEKILNIQNNIEQIFAWR